MSFNLNFYLIFISNQRILPFLDNPPYSQTPPFPEKIFHPHPYCQIRGTQSNYVSHQRFSWKYFWLEKQIIKYFWKITTKIYFLEHFFFHFIFFFFNHFHDYYSLLKTNLMKPTQKSQLCLLYLFEGKKKKRINNFLYLDKDMFNFKTMKIIHITTFFI